MSLASVAWLISPVSRIDASSREVSGKAVINATYGTFLIASSVQDYVLRPGATTTVTIRAVDYVGAVQPNQRVEIAVGRRQPNGNWDSADGVLIV